MSPWFQGFAIGAGVLIASALTAATRATGPFSYALAAAVAAAIAGGTVALFNQSRIVVATSERLVFLQAERFRPTRATSVLGELPRNTLLGPPNGHTWSIVVGVANGQTERMYVHFRFFKDMNQADRMRQGI
ncbi:MAG: hypothetical protein WC054_09750 [Candidatus Nanopelagicales bacterium]